MGMIGSDIDEAVTSFAATLDRDVVALARAASVLAQLAWRSVDDSLPAPVLNVVVEELTAVSYSLSATLDVALDRWDRAGAWVYDGALSGSGWRRDSTRHAPRPRT